MQFLTKDIFTEKRCFIIGNELFRILFIPFRIGVYIMNIKTNNFFIIFF